MNAIKVRFKTPSKHRKNWHEDHEYTDHQSASVNDAIAVAKSNYPEAYDFDCQVVKK